MYGFAISNIIGVCLGFMFGVGCALAVMYSIFMGGYRAALKDLAEDVRPKRYFEELAKVEKMRPKQVRVGATSGGFAEKGQR